MRERANLFCLVLIYKATFGCCSFTHLATLVVVAAVVVVVAQPVKIKATLLS